MISLVELLKEIQKSPKAIVMGGAAGSGKSFVIKKYLGDIKGDIFTVKGSDVPFKYLNLDTYIENEGLSLAKATQNIKQDLSQAKEESKNILWDATGANVKNTLSTVSGYKTFMVMVYTHPIVSLLQNFKRDRSLPMGAVFKTWESVYSNIEEYKNALGENFQIIENIPPQFNKDIQEFNKYLNQGYKGVKKYLDNLISQDPNKFKSSFSKEFSFKDKEVETFFNNHIKDLDINPNILNNLQKDFEATYEKKGEDPGKERILNRIEAFTKSLDKKQQQNIKNIENIVKKLLSSQFKEILNPKSPEEVLSKLKKFINE